jgi:hypothetical protein
MRKVVSVVFSKSHNLVYLFLAIVVSQYIGCSSANQTAIESDQIEIGFAALSKPSLEHPLGMFVLHNRTEDDCRVLRATITSDTGASEVVLDLLKVTSRSLHPDAWEYAILQLNEKDVAAAIRLRVEYESKGRLYFSSRLIERSDVWCDLTYSPSDSGSLLMYAEIPERWDSEPCCLVNGVEAGMSTSQIEAADGTYVVAARIAPKQALESGARVFAQLMCDDGTQYCGATKLFQAFVAGKTQYELVVRAVEVDQNEESVKLRLYNEAGFRKSPAVIEKVRVNGVDVTEQSVLPEDALPPDLHNYDEDLRELVVHYPSSCPSERLHFDIDFRRLPPLRSEPTPANYFETQTTSFDTQQGAPLAIGPESGFGLANGVCILYGGLRPRPALSEIMRRSAAAAENVPTIPVFASVSYGTAFDNIHRIAACTDFLLSGQPAPVNDSVRYRSGVFFDLFRRLDDLPVPWAASILIGRDQCTAPAELEWIAWATIGLGGRGILLSYSDRGADNETALAAHELAVTEIVEDVGSLASLLEKSHCVSLNSECNQEGVRINFLLCGPEQLLIIAVNDWISRASFQCDEPYMVAVRHGVELQFSAGSDWVPESAIDPLAQKPLPFRCGSDGTTTIHLPQFDTVQLIVLKRGDESAGGLSEPLVDASEELPPLVFCGSPVVSLGTVRPESAHHLEIPIRSFSNEPLALVGTGVSERTSRPGTFSAGGVTVSPGKEAVLAIDYTAPANDGRSVTNIQFTSKQHPNVTMPVYICAEIEDPVTLSPTLVDFGPSANGSATDAREVTIRSSDPSARIARITAESTAVHNIQIADDGRSFSFSLWPMETGHVSSTLTVEVLLDHGRETVRRSAAFAGKSEEAVFVTPPRIAVVESSRAKNYTLLVEHVSDQAIEITDVSHGDAIRSHFESETCQTTQEVELTLLPTIRDEEEWTVTIRGKTNTEGAFTIVLPVSVISLAKGSRQ